MNKRCANLHASRKLSGRNGVGVYFERVGERKSHSQATSIASLPLNHSNQSNAQETSVRTLMISR